MTNLSEQTRIALAVAYAQGAPLNHVLLKGGISRAEALELFESANILIRPEDQPVNHLPERQSFYDQVHETRITEILTAMGKQVGDQNAIPSAWISELVAENEYLTGQDVGVSEEDPGDIDES